MDDRERARLEAEIEALRAQVKALEQSHETLRTVLDTVPQRVFWKDRSLRYLGANRLFLEDAGLDGPEALVGRRDEDLPWRELAHVYQADDTEVLSRRIEKLNYEEPGIREGGRLHWLRTTKVPLKGPDGEVIGVFGCFEDITDRIRADEALRQSEERYRTLVEQASDGIFIADLSGHYVDVNAAGCAMLGFTKEEILGFTIRDLISEEDQDRVPPLVAELQSGATVISERRLKTRDGRMLEVEMSAKVIAGGYLQGIVRDISGRKQAERERRRLEEKLRQAQRLESVGRLAGGVAHDFNNLLSVIIGGGHLVRRELPDGSRAHEDLDDILAAAEGAANLTRQLLAFSRNQVLEPELLDLGETVRRIAKMVARMAGDTVEVVLDLDDDAAQVEVDRSQLEQVILNLVVNARDAMPDGGRLTIQTGRATPTEAERESSPGLKGEAHLCLRVTDTGAGMDAETAGHVFEPFFTTKGPGEGTGLGLATVYGIVAQSGGIVRVHSRVGQGTTFEVLLPEAKPRTRSRPAPAPAIHGTPGGQTLLVVEDEDVLRSMLRRMLEPEGYRLLLAESGEDALRMSRAHPDAIDLVVTDVMMPGMTGVELARHLEAERPGIGVLLMSGYAEQALSRDGTLEGRPFLAKPFTAGALLDRIQAILGPGARRLADDEG